MKSDTDSTDKAQQNITEVCLSGSENKGETDCLHPLTGLYRRTRFFRAAESFLKGRAAGSYCLMAIDIEHFKLFNEWYGTKAGDKFLISIGRYLKKAEKENGGIAGYMGGDNFAILILKDETLLKALRNQILGFVRQYGDNAGFLPAFGLYDITDNALSVSTMYDRACLALESIKGNYAQRVCWYADVMMKKIEDEHLLLTDVQRALVNGEFVFYAQPKCHMSTGKIVGLESLIRWKHPQKGIIPPNDFIPVLEQNGLITDLDLYVWDMVCSSVRGWIDRGHRAVPISLNVSRMDIYALDVVETFRRLIKQYDLDTRLIEIEITESAYAENSEAINDVVDNLRKAGFTVLMDDFGSGYSSLNMLKDVNVDVLKIDMKFLEMNEQTAGKGVGILEAITSMARMMGLRIIAEGVEAREQVDFLLEMGCHYGQGYYFYRPMPVEELEILLADEDNIDFRGIKAKQMERLHIRELLDDNYFSETLLDNILGGVAFYDVFEGQITLVRVNEQYYKVTGSNPVDLAEKRSSILENVYEEDRPSALSVFELSRRDRLHGGQGDFRRLCDDGRTIWLHLHAFFLKEQDGHCLYYGSVSDITEQKRREQDLESSQRALSAIVHISEKDEGLAKLPDENRRTAASIFAQMSPGGMIGGYCEPDYPLYFANYEMVKLLGYDSYEEFSEAIHGKVVNTIHPDDRKQVAKDIGSRYYAGLQYTTTYRMPKKDGTWFWTLDKGKIVDAGDGRLAIVSACTDISESMAVQQRLTERNFNLIRQNQELHFLNNDMPGGYHRCAKTPDFDFTYISNRFLSIFGYTRQEIHDLFDDKFINMVHPEDRKLVSDGVMTLQHTDAPYALEYRMKSKNGYIWVIDQSRYMEYEGKSFLQGVVMDITDKKRREQEIFILNQKMELILQQAGINCWDWNLGENIVTLNHNILAGRLSHVSKTDGGTNKLLTDFPENFLTSPYFPAEYVDTFRDYIKRILREKGNDLICLEFPLYPDPAQTVWIKAAGTPVRDQTGRVTNVIGFYTDVTRQRLEALKNRENTKALEMLKIQSIYSFEVNLTQDLLFTEMDGDLWMSEAGCKSGDKFSDLVNGICQKLVLPEYQEDFLAFCSRERLIGLCKEERKTISMDYRRLLGGHPRWTRLIIQFFGYHETTEVYAYFFILDVDSQKRQEIRLTRLAETDALTGLYNRQTAITKIKQCLLENPQQTAAVIMFDLDNFKLANDVFGHAYGDSVIAETAHKLKGFFRSDDILCRIGGDEFLVMCRNISKEALDKKLEPIISSMRKVLKDDAHEVVFSLSVGYALIPEHGNDFDTLYRCADIALFTAKMEGKSSFRQYDPSMKSVRFELAFNRPRKP